MKNFFKTIISKALFFESRIILKKYKPRIIAITGSVGKTSTKDAVFAVLSQFDYVRKSDKSYNSEIGIPLTILGVPNGWDNPLIWISNLLKGLWLILWTHDYPHWLVLETGVGKPNDMKKIASLIYSDVVILTRFSPTPVHVEFFQSAEHVFKEKALLLTTLKDDGLMVLNQDDDTIMSLKDKAKQRLVTFGTTTDATVYVSNAQIYYEGSDNIPLGVTFRINYEGNSLPVVLNGVFGKNHISSALIALTLAHTFGFNMITAVEALKEYDLPPGRMRLIEGEKNTSIIDDTYNSSPIAVEAALSTLGEIKTIGRKIVVLGDMLELGKHTDDAHREVGTLAKDVADIIIAVGKRAQTILKGAVDAGFREDKVFYFDNSKMAGEHLEEIIQPRDVILVKGSQGMRMERIVEEIMAHPELKDKLLARQEEEWLQKK